MHYLRFFMVLLLFVLGSMVHGQTPKLHDTLTMICQKWKFTEMHSDSYDEKNKSDMQELQQMIKYSRLIFRSDMTFIFGNEGKDMGLGKWQYNSLKKEIIQDRGNGVKIFMKIVLLTPTKLKFESWQPKGGVHSSGIMEPTK